MRRFSLIPAALAICAGVAAAQDSTKAPSEAEAIKRSADAATRRTTRLFGDETPLELRLTADYRTVFRDRDTMSTKRYPATLSMKDTSGNPVTFGMEISPRGHFRLLAQNCPFPPIRLGFPKDSATGTAFAGQKSIKLGTHCRPGEDEYEQYVLREYLVYRTYTLFTDLSFKARLAKVTYVEAKDTTKTQTKYGLLIEDEDDVAKRNGGKIAETRGARFDDLDEKQLTLAMVFSYFAGNTDWSLFSLHNLRLMQTTSFEHYPVPYDFDWSGIVATRYSRPDYRLPIKDVRERLYRGPCRKPEQLQPVLDMFKERRPAIEALYGGLKDLDEGYRKWVKEYINEFYRTIENPGRMKRELIDACAGRESA